MGCGDFPDFETSPIGRPDPAATPKNAGESILASLRPHDGSQPHGRARAGAEGGASHPRVETAGRETLRGASPPSGLDNLGYRIRWIIGWGRGGLRGIPYYFNFATQPRGIPYARLQHQAACSSRRHVVSSPHYAVVDIIQVIGGAPVADSPCSTGT